MKPALEISGYIQKKEELISISENIIKGTLVLQTTHPFAGYYCGEIPEHIPQSVFFITNSEYQRDQIARASTKIKKYIPFEFDAERSEVTIYNTVYNAIRLYDIKEPSQIKILQEAFLAEGLTFKTSKKTYKDEFEIRIWKVFLLDEISEGVYLNMSKSKMFYFTLPHHLTFVHFNSLVEKVKNNWDGKSFDAAYGMLYRKQGVKEIVRIFSNHITDEMISELPQKFLRYIE